MLNRIDKMQTALEGVRASLEVMIISLEGKDRPADSVLVSALMGYAGTLDALSAELNELGKEVRA